MNHDEKVRQAIDAWWRAEAAVENAATALRIAEKRASDSATKIVPAMKARGIETVIYNGRQIRLEEDGDGFTDDPFEGLILGPGNEQGTGGWENLPPSRLPLSEEIAEGGVPGQ